MYVGSGAPPHVPAAHVSVEPKVGVPLMLGCSVSSGTLPGTATLALVACTGLPTPFSAVTTHESL